MKKIIKDQNGTTLMEMIVALAIFAVITVMSVGIFQAVIASQASTVSAQNKQESLKYVFEVISKEIRSAVRADHDCELGGGSVAVDKIYNRDSILNAESDILYFKDKDGVCTYYQIDDGTFTVTKGVGGTVSSTTPRDVLVTSFDFAIIDNPIIQLINTAQPIVTFSIGIEDRAGKDIEKQAMVVQSTISSRYYE